MKTFMDEVVFNATGNEMRMTLRDLRPLAATAGDALAGQGFD